MKKLEVNQMENLNGGKFWGWGAEDCSACSGGIMLCTSNYYVLWTVVDYNVVVKRC